MGITVECLAIYRGLDQGLEHTPQLLSTVLQDTAKVVVWAR